MLTRRNLFRSGIAALATCLCPWLPKPLREPWGRYKYRYANVTKEELVRLMREAYRRIKFTPPLKRPEYRLYWPK